MAAQYLVLPREKEDAFPLYFEEMMTGEDIETQNYLILTVEIFQVIMLLLTIVICGQECWLLTFSLLTLK